MAQPVQHNKPKLWEQHEVPVLPTFQPTQLSTTNKYNNYDLPSKTTPTYSYNFNESRDQKYQAQQKIQNGRLQHNDRRATYWAPFLTKTANTMVYDQQNFESPSYKSSSSTVNSFNSFSRSSKPSIPYSSIFTCR